MVGPRSADARGLSLEEIAARPDRAARTFRVPPRGRATLRPFQLGDEAAVIEFFDGLSEATRAHYAITDPGETVAQEWSRSIAVHRKLRLLLHRVGRGSEPRSGVRLSGVVEVSLDLTEADRERYGRWGIPLRPGSAIRFGICLADDEQGTGLARAAMPGVRDLATRLGRRRIVLWDGVLAQNGRAIAFYERSGFRTAGTWTDGRGRVRRDMFADV